VGWVTKTFRSSIGDVLSLFARQPYNLHKMPSYNEEKTPETVEYEKMRKELKELIDKKRHMDRNLNGVEEQIFKLEGAYLEDTNNGNVVRGFDNYIKGGQTKRRTALNENDRIFSQSSAVFLKARMKEEENQ
jgi:chromatin modification-related protein EAF6